MLVTIAFIAWCCDHAYGFIKGPYTLQVRYPVFATALAIFGFWGLWWMAYYFTNYGTLGTWLFAGFVELVLFCIVALVHS